MELWKLFDSNQDVRQKKAIVIGLTRQLSDKYLPNLANQLGINYYVNFVGRLGSIRFQLKWTFGTHGNKKKSKSWWLFWNYQLNSTANSAHLAHFRGKWAGLAVLVAPKRPPGFWFFSTALGADYSFEGKNIEIWAPTFFKHNNSSVATMLAQ